MTQQKPTTPEKAPSNSAPLSFNGVGDFEGTQSAEILKDRVSAFQHLYSPNKSVRLCGRGVLKKYDQAEIVVWKDRSVSFAGLSSCGAHYCVKCASKSRESHAKAMVKGLNQAVKEGNNVWFGTLTVATCEMEKQVELMRGAWRAFNLRLKRELDKVNVPLSIYKAYDFTINENKREKEALHLHIHFVLVLPPQEEMKDLLSESVRFFVRKVRKLGGNAVSVAQEIELAQDMDAVAFYCAKLVKEVSNTATKTKKAKVGGGLSLVPWLNKVVQVEDQKKFRKCVRIYRNLQSALKDLRIFSRTKAFGELVARSEHKEEPKEEKAFVYALSVGPRCLVALARTHRMNEFGKMLSDAVFSESPRLKAWLKRVEITAEASLREEADDYSLSDWANCWDALFRAYGSYRWTDRTPDLKQVA